MGYLGSVDTLMNSVRGSGNGSSNSTRTTRSSSGTTQPNISGIDTNSASNVALEGPFSDAFNPALSAVNSGIPPGLSDAQLGVLKSRVAGGAQAGANQAIASAAGATGGVSNPQFARLASMARLAQQTQASAKMADIDIAETQRKQDLENTRRGQLLQLASIGGNQSQAAGQLLLGGQSLGLDAEKTREGQYEFNTSVDENRHAQDLNLSEAEKNRQVQLAQLVGSNPSLDRSPTRTDHWGSTTRISSDGQSLLERLGLVSGSSRANGYTYANGGASNFGYI